MAVATAPAKNKATPAHAAKGAVQSTNPFTKAAPKTVEPCIDITTALAAGSVRIDPQNIPATGFLRHIVLFVTISGIPTTATLMPDAPWSVFDSISFLDVNSQPLHTLTGYDLMLANDVGAYTQHADPSANPFYNINIAGGTMQFALRVPVEIIARGALGALENTNGSMLYRLGMRLAPEAAIFASNPGGNVRIRAYVESWGNPAPADVHGAPNTPEPPALGTTQNWSEQAFPLIAGKNTLRLGRVGNAIRNLVLVCRDNTGARVDAFPDEIGLYYDGNQRLMVSTDYLKMRQYELFGRTFPTGVIALSFTDDFDGTPGEEMGDFWLQTSGATRLEFQATFANPAASLTVLTNDVLAVAAPSGPGQTQGA